MKYTTKSIIPEKTSRNERIGENLFKISKNIFELFPNKKLKPITGKCNNDRVTYHYKLVK
jgi:hypothetical protein